MSVAWYQLFYLHPGDRSWIPVQSKMTVGKHDDILANWDTYGLSPGAYTIKLVLCDNTADSNKIEALKAINLLPKILGMKENDDIRMKATISPNPVGNTSILTIETLLSKSLSLTIVDVSGKVVRKSVIKLSEGKYIIRIGDLNLNSGVYCCILDTGGLGKL